MDGLRDKMTLSEFASNRTVLVYLALVLFVILAGIVMPQSLGARSLQTIIRESSLLGIVALGQGIVMLSGGLDISVGNVMFFVIVFGGNLMSRYPEWTLPILLLCLLIGAFVGAVNGIGVARFKISSIIMTLATSSILYGSVYILGGETLSGSAHPALRYVGKKMVTGFMPLTGLIWLFLALAATFVLYYTIFGRRVYATGSNPLSAWLSGVNVVGVTIASYIICALSAALAGLLLLGYLGTPTLRFTDIYTMGSIAAVVLGGIEFFRGVGSILGTIAGAFLVRFMFTLLIMFNVAEAGRMIAEGSMIIIIVAAYNFRKE